MSYFIVAIIFAVIGFVACFLIERNGNNACRIKKLEEIIRNGDIHSQRTIEAIQEVITGECKPKDDCGCN